MVRQWCHHIHVVVSQTLDIIFHMTVDGGCTTNGSCDVYTSRIGANDDVLPSVNHDAIDAVAMKHTHL